MTPAYGCASPGHRVAVFLGGAAAAAVELGGRLLLGLIAALALIDVLGVLALRAHAAGVSRRGGLDGAAQPRILFVVPVSVSCG